MKMACCNRKTTKDNLCSGCNLRADFCTCEPLAAIKHGLHHFIDGKKVLGGTDIKSLEYVRRSKGKLTNIKAI